MFPPAGFELSPAANWCVVRPTRNGSKARKDPLVVSQAKRREAACELIRYGLGQTSVAAILVAASDKGVVAILIQEHPGDEKLVEALRVRFPRAELRHDGAGTREMVEAVVSFVESPRGNLRLPLKIRGTDFPRRVWGAVSKIRSGGQRPSLRSPAQSAPQKRCGPSAPPARRTRSSSPFPAIAC
jgi:hypothetical protein